MVHFPSTAAARAVLVVLVLYLLELLGGHGGPLVASGPLPVAPLLPGAGSAAGRPADTEHKVFFLV